MRFRPGVEIEARERFYARHGLAPLVEYPPGEGRVLARVQGHRSRLVLDVSNGAYFDPEVEYVTPNFAGDVRLGGDCFDANYTPPPDCRTARHGGVDCADVEPCLPSESCPTCDCTRETSVFPSGPGDDVFADDFFIFERNGVWDAWSVTAGSPDVKICVLDTPVDRNHRDLAPQLALDLNPANLGHEWLTYTVDLPAQSVDPDHIYMYFVDAPDPLVSGSEFIFHLDNLLVVEAPSGPEVVRYSFEEDDPNWQNDFSLPTASSHLFERVSTTQTERDLYNETNEDGIDLESYVLAVSATGAGDPVTNCIRIAIPELLPGKDYRITTHWVPNRPGVPRPPLEARLRFGIAGDESCNVRYDVELGTAAGPRSHGTQVAGIACGADNVDDYGITGVAPGCRLFSVSLVSEPGSTVFAEGTAFLAAARAGADIMTTSAQLAYTNDDYFDALWRVINRGRGGRGTVFVQLAGNQHGFVERDWPARSRDFVSVGGLSLDEALGGTRTWRKSCKSSYGADVYVYERFNLAVNEPWVFELFTVPVLRPTGDRHELPGPVPFPGEFVRFDEVPIDWPNTPGRRWPSATSWCTPVVGGTMGLVLSRDPDLTRREALEILFHTAQRPDGNGMLAGYYLDCGVPNGDCSTGVEGGGALSLCAGFVSDPENPDFVEPQSDIPFDPVTCRSKVFGYGLLDAHAAVLAADPVAGKRWPPPPRALDVLPAKDVQGQGVVRVSWLPPEENEHPRASYDGYVLIRSIDQQLTAKPADGASTVPQLGSTLNGGTVIAVGEDEVTHVDDSTEVGLRHYALFYYRTFDDKHYFSFGEERCIVYDPDRWTTVTNALALQLAVSAGLDSTDGSSWVVVFVDPPGAMQLFWTVPVVSSHGSEATGHVYLLGDPAAVGDRSTLLAPTNGDPAIEIEDSSYVSLSGFVLEGGDTGIYFGPGTTQDPNRADEVVISGCVLRGQDIGVRLENEGKVFLQNNVIEALDSCEALDECAGIFLPDRPTPVYDDRRTFYSALNNTLSVANRPALRVHMTSLDQQFAFGNVRLQVYNNILLASGPAASCCSLETASLHYFLSNHNAFVYENGAVCGRVSTPEQDLPTIAEWRAVNKGDKWSLPAIGAGAVDPGFVDVGAGDYHLAEKTSPCVNAGTLDVYEPRFLPVEFDPDDPGRVWSRLTAFGGDRALSLGIDIGADEFHAAIAADDADLGHPFVRGDANNDGNVQVNDAQYILNYLFLGGPAPVCFDAADADDSEDLENTDANVLLNYLFNPGLTAFPELIGLPPPFPECGYDVYKVGPAGPPPTSGPFHCDLQAVACPP